MMDINKIQSAQQSLKEESAHIEEYLQNAAERKKELEIRSGMLPLIDTIENSEL